ncbi:MAG: VanZ family protein [Clostridia bacterium]|nr:VanZ family protein [Clostridia bacterium]
MKSIINRLHDEILYRHSIAEILLWGVLLTAFWFACAVMFTKTKSRQEAWVWINRLLLAVFVIAALYITVFMRSAGSHDISLLPFDSFTAAHRSLSRSRCVAANFLMFIPFGLTMPFVLQRPLILGNGVRHPATTAVAAAAGLSVAIELTQYIFQLGYCEVDDVIFNTLGTAFGTLSFTAAVRFRAGAKRNAAPE